MTKNNYGPPQKGNLYLRRDDNGVLESWVPDDFSQNTLLDQIMAEVGALWDSGTPMMKTQFIKKYGGKTGKFAVSEKNLREAVAKAIDMGNIVEQPGAKSGQGAKGKLLMPVDHD